MAWKLLVKPLANNQCYILNNDNLVPSGVAGELFIGGIGLARGYLNRPSLTARQFVPNPFSDEPGARLYQTGDLVRYLPEGNIGYLGREDHQVKIRGFRIEVGEIESVLMEHSKVKDAVVIEQELSAEKEVNSQQLFAYVVPCGEESDTELPSSEPNVLGESLLNSLKRQLPSFMIPSEVIILAKLPLTPNGKLDRSALDAPTGKKHVDLNTPPEGDVEQILAHLWQRILGCEAVSRHDTFFDLGGHSLLATQLVTLIRIEFRVELPLRTLFEQHNLGELALLIERLPKTKKHGRI